MPRVDVRLGAADEVREPWSSVLSLDSLWGC